MHTLYVCVCVCVRIVHGPTLARLQRIPEVLQCSYKLSAEIKPIQNSELIIPIFWSSLAIALTAAVPFLQLGHEKSFIVIVERTQI